MDWNKLLSDLIHWLSTSGVKLLLGFIGLLLLFKIINVVTKRIKIKMEKKNIEKTIVSVTYGISRNFSKVIVFVMFLGFLGFDTTSIGALIASFGVGIGLAMQGSLANIAGGILIIILRPFKLGDYIEAQNVGGTVDELSIFYTYLVTPDNKVIMIPNGSLLNGNITNYSKKSIRRVDMSFSISYNEDFDKAIAIIKDLCAKNEMILKSPEPFVRVSGHKDSCIALAVRVWANSGDYWSIFFDMQEQVKKRFDEEKITIPFPQIDVHIDKNLQ